MQKSPTQVLEECSAFDAELGTADELHHYPDYRQFDAMVHFFCDFRLRDYQVFSIVTFRFAGNKAVECVISLGEPASLKRYRSEFEVTKSVLLSLEELYLNGRIQKEDKPETRVYTWKKDNRTVVSFIAYPPSGRPKDSAVHLSLQIRDTQLHPRGGNLELLNNEAQKSVQDLVRKLGDESNASTHRVGADLGEPSGGNDISEKKMRDLLARGYSIKHIAKMLGMAEDFIQEVVDGGWGQFDFRALIGKRVLVKEKLKPPGSEQVVIGTATVIIKEISSSGDRVLLEYPKPAGIGQWTEVKNLKIISELGDESDTPAPGGDIAPVETVELSKQLESFCSDYITALGRALDIAIRVGHQEYEAGFNSALDILSKGPAGLNSRNPFRFGVPQTDRPKVLSEIKRYAEVSGIPYNKLSPLNQFIVAIPPYIFYCLEKYLPNDPGLREEARLLMNTRGFPRYLQENWGIPISRTIKRAFWIPKPFGFLTRLFDFGRRH